MHFFTVRFVLAPLTSDMAMHFYLFTVLIIPKTIFNPKPVKPCRDFPLLIIKIYDPCIQLFKLCKQVSVA